ncbi:vWA domain-containing protein [Pseudonocardia sp.]|uniref:vWA domain-containing protein n=1 Tax=Pseudonocardia sp. TaxID=60912 RepID=UPI003D09901E
MTRPGGGDSAGFVPERPLLEELVGFCEQLQAEGVRIDSGRMQAFCDAVADLGPENTFWVGRALLTADRDDRPAYDRVFRRYWRARGRASTSVESSVPQEQEKSLVVDDAAGGERPPDGRLHFGVGTSWAEVLRAKSGPALTADELAELQRRYRRLVVALPARTTPRTRPSATGPVDLPRTVRQALRTGGEPVPLATSRSRARSRRLVLLLDVSRSMSQHSERMALFAHSLVQKGIECEVFCFATRLSRVTPVLTRRGPREALTEVTTEVVDWDGGTRVGESLGQLLADPRNLSRLRGSVCVIVSDGLDTGDPDLVDRTIGRLRRTAHRLVWMNPVADEPGYAPTARAMRAALPHLDAFVPGADPTALVAALAPARYSASHGKADRRGRAVL